ncbi:MAG: putative sugar phosphatases of the HAD superfamily [Rhodobacteraceae bacterium HLUCCA12]|nr:MAG: putative sugar phosphatases of the HAD superfamily [Rhodobacteraceae bacterium HLUCCA12]
MTEIIESLADIGARYDVLYCDLWGCLHDGRALYPDAVAAVQAFRRGGGAVVLMTNAPRTRHAVERRLRRMGLPDDAWDLIVSSGDATQEAMLLGAAGRKLWHLGPGKDEDLFSEIPEALADQPPIERVPFDRAEGIICTGPFDEYNDTLEDYRGRFLSAKARGLTMLSANPDLMVDVGEIRIHCAGALAQLYAQMGGDVLSFGKPHPPIYDLARRRLAERGLPSESDRILAVGDGILTDVAGAQGEGIDALFVTGGLETRRFGTDPARPDTAGLRDWLREQGRTPRYAIGRLR